MVSAGITQEGLCLARDSAAEKTKDSASIFYEVGVDISGTVKGKMDETGFTDGAKVAGGFVLENSVAGARTVKDKMDETGITDGAIVAGEVVLEMGVASVSYINDSIDQNPTLAGIKTSTA